MKPAGSMNVTTPTDREIVITRFFEAPRAMVWEAMTRPELLKRWLAGPPGWAMTQCEEDPRVGGKFRWEWRGPNGEQMAMHGVYREVMPPQRMVRDETFEFGCVAPGSEQVGTLVLAEQGGRTTMTLTVLYASKEVRDATIASGMEHGMAAGYNRLDELLAATSAR